MARLVRVRQGGEWKAGFACYPSDGCDVDLIDARRLATALMARHGLTGWLAAIVALLVSGVIALPLARRQRDEITQAFTQRRGRR